MDENHPGHEAWTERQIAWYGVSAQLWKRELVRVVVPADGSHGDLVEVTDAGRGALHAAVARAWRRPSRGHCPAPSARSA